MTYQQYIIAITPPAAKLGRLLATPDPAKASWCLQLNECMDTLADIHAQHGEESARVGRYTWQTEEAGAC